MIMVNFDFLSEPLCLHDHTVQVLCIENQQLFRKVLGWFLWDETEENHIVFSKNFEPFRCNGNVCVVDDFYRLSYSHSMVKKLYQQIENYCNTEYAQETLALTSHLVNFMDSIVCSFDYDLEFCCNVNLSEVFKLMELKPVVEKIDLLNSLLDYILILNRYTSPKCFVLFNLHLYFTPKEISLLYQDLLNHHISVLVVENTKFFHKNAQENVVVLDNDFCEIIET